MDIRWLVKNAMVAAAYTALTVVMAPLSYGMIQVRFAEVMTLLAVIDKRYVPGLVAGCFLSNLESPLGMIDIVVGTAATFFSVFCMSRCKSFFAAVVFPVVFNGVFIGAELWQLGLLPEDVGLLPAMLYVAAGEFIAVGIVGAPLMKLLMEHSRLKNII